MNKTIVSIVLAILLICFLSGCGPVSTPVPPTATPPPPTNTPMPTATPPPPTNTPMPTKTTAPTAEPTATDAPPTSTPLPPTPEAGPLAQPEITDTDRENNSLLKTCERTFIVTADQVLVPLLSDCYHQLCSPR